MKFNTIIITVLALITAGITGYISNVLVNVQPTAVIHAPTNKSKNGSGFTVEVPTKLTERQSYLLALAFDIAKKDGHAHPQILQGIILQESKAGTMKSYKVAGQEFGLRANERYYGVAQIKLAAAKDVLADYPNLFNEFNFHTKTDEEIIANLIVNDHFNLSIASKYLIVLKRYGYDTIQQLALAYNQGPGGARNYDSSEHHYSIGVMKHIQQLPQKKVKSDKTV